MPINRKTSNAPPMRKFIDMTVFDNAAMDIATIGRNIKKLRRDKKLTLKQLSTLSGVSIATISKIENNRISGGFETIYKIARGLGVLVTKIMDAEQAVTRAVVVNKANPKAIHPTLNYDYFPLAHRRNGALNPYEMIIKTHKLPDERDWSIHDGEEVIIVLSGSIELHLEGHGPYRLSSGDSACFDCGIRHAFVSVSEDDARIISLSSLGPATRVNGKLVFS